MPKSKLPRPTGGSTKPKTPRARYNATAKDVIGKSRAAKETAIKKARAKR